MQFIIMCNYSVRNLDDRDESSGRLTTTAAVYIAAMTIAAAAVGDCGPGYISDDAYRISDTVDHLHTISPTKPVSDPFLLLANEVSNRKASGLSVTADDLVKNCSVDFAGIVHDLR